VPYPPTTTCPILPASPPRTTTTTGQLLEPLRTTDHPGGAPLPSAYPSLCRWRTPLLLFLLLPSVVMRPPRQGVGEQRCQREDPGPRWHRLAASVEKRRGSTPSSPPFLVFSTPELLRWRGAPAEGLRWRRIRWHQALIRSLRAQIR
jgi:hypothetical protein